MQTHGFCTLHKIAYNRALDGHCPQCILQGISQPVKQLDFHPRALKPIDDVSGNLLDPITMQVWLQPDFSTAKPVSAASV